MTEITFRAGLHRRRLSAPARTALTIGGCADNPTSPIMAGRSKVGSSGQDACLRLDSPSALAASAE
jgi:hypothetical protein